MAAAKPGLAKLSAALTKAIPAVKHTTPLTKALRSYTSRSLAKTKLSGRLFTSLQQVGFGENFLGIVYYVAASLSRFDSVSHMLSFASVNPSGCVSYATKPVPGCEANYGSSSANVSLARRAHSVPSSAPSASPHASAPSSSAPRSRPQQATQTPSPPSATQQPPTAGATNVLQNLLNFLVR